MLEEPDEVDWLLKVVRTRDYRGASDDQGASGLMGKVLPSGLGNIKFTCLNDSHNAVLQLSL